MADQFRSPSKRRGSSRERSASCSPENVELPPLPRPPSAQEVEAARRHLTLLKSKLPPRKGSAGRERSEGPPRDRSSGGGASSPQQHRAAAVPRNRSMPPRGPPPEAETEPYERPGGGAPRPPQASVAPPQHMAEYGGGEAGDIYSSAGGNFGGGGGGGGNLPDEDAPPGMLVQCEDCGRSFSEESIEKHRRICKKVFQQKRKKFDSAANRLGEFDNAKELISQAKKIEAEVKSKDTKVASPKAGDAGKKDSKDAKDNKPMPAWKKKSLEFRQQMLAAKAAGGDETAKAKAEELNAELGQALKDAGPDPNKETCPHCGRSFNKESAQRHINICLKTFGSKPGGGRLVRGGGGNCNSKVEKPPPEEPKVEKRRGRGPGRGGPPRI